MKTIWIAIALCSSTAIADPATPTVVEPLGLPNDAKVIGTTTLDSIRAFPDLQLPRGGEVERVVGTSAVDRLYSTKLGYRDVVAFFDQQAKRQGLQIVQRSQTPASTAWLLRRGDNTSATVIVRNTKPVTFETVQAASVSTPAESEAPRTR